MNFPKQERVEDPVYVAWCRTQPCTFCTQDKRKQRFPTEAHHVIKRSSGTLRDDTVIPVCLECHQRCHGIVSGGRRSIYLADQVREIDVHRDRFKNSSGDCEW